MFLKRLEIQGFKSFARRTIFEFLEKSHANAAAKSITAVVGPNGSGKSNVADAIRWVLGEQSLKLIRCKKPDDVIFSGSEKKARQGFAEVVLYMDNQDRALPIDYSEVVITRRVYRNGDAEYLINKNKVRLFDILVMLAQANFGQRSYSIVGQGMVDHIINISPFERKDFFDEATGIKQYQIKRDQAVNRLARSRDNLGQTNKILAELEPRLRSLGRQMKKLEKRQELEKALRELQKKYYGQLLGRWQKEFSRWDETAGIKEALRQDLEARLAEAQSKLSSYARQESRRDIFNALQKEHNKLITERSELQKEQAMLAGKTNLEYLKLGKQNLAWLNDRRRDAEKRELEINESLNNLNSRLSQKQAYLQENEGKLAQIQNEAVLSENNLRAIEVDLAQMKNSGRAGLSFESVAAIRRQNFPGILGAVSELGKVEPMYEQALAAAAGSKISALVVQTDEVAIRCIKYLKENKLAPVTFLALNKIKPAQTEKRSKESLSKPGAIAMAVDLVSCEPEFRKVFCLILGSTIVIDRVESAKNVGIGAERLVTIDGDLFEKSGIIRGGFQKKFRLSWLTDGQDSQMAAQAQNIKEAAVLKARIVDLARQKEAAMALIQNLRVEIEVAETKSKSLRRDFDDLDREKAKVESEIQASRLSPEDEERYLKNLNSRCQEVERQIAAADKKIFSVRQNIDHFNLEEEKKKNEVFEAQREMQQYQVKLNAAVAELNEVKVALAKLDAKKEDLEREIKQELRAGAAIVAGEADLTINVDQQWFEIGKLKRELEQIGGIDEEVSKEHGEVAQRYEYLLEQSKDLEKAIADLDKIVKELDDIIGNQFGDSFKKINQAFAKYFNQIFCGGKARLDLIQREKSAECAGNSEAEQLPGNENAEMAENSADNMQNIGIEIMVAPPNKKIKNIAALSGGERTMTSLALICAIIDSNPAPFVVMDEVDAALDEANSEKFSAILRQLSLKSQFVVITHNRVVMHAADVLYGVAMGDDGVSKILSLDLEQAEKRTKK